ncbi:MAG TPA: hypothetical protein VLC46_26705 [Thermoanaerobaculia bacterium]|jgi:hypothetical protein|nr:hypothetical protein [Thermoanaerobaculia bacterium]
MPQRVSKSDNDILKFAASFVNLRTSDICDLTGRSLRRIQRRMRKLRLDENGGLGLFYDDLRNPANPFEKVHRLTQKGWDEALRRNLLDKEVNANREKSEGQLEHDLVLTDFHKALHRTFGANLNWSQLYAARYKRWGKGRDEYVNADAFFFIEKDGEYSAFFVEIENQKGVEEPLRKMRAYAEFADGHYQEMFNHSDFRVIILKPTPAMTSHVLSAAREDKAVNTRRFWLTDYDSALKPSERVFKTPKDFETASYSLLFA